MAITLLSDISAGQGLVAVTNADQAHLDEVLTIGDETVVVRNRPRAGGKLILGRGLLGTERVAHLAGATLNPRRGAVDGTFVQLYASGPDSGGSLAHWDEFSDADGNVLVGIPAGMGLEFNPLVGDGQSEINAVEAGIWLFSGYVTPTKDNTALVVAFWQSDSPSGGPKNQWTDVSTATWGVVAIEAGFADVFKATGPMDRAIRLNVTATGATAGPYVPLSDAGLTIVRLA